MNMEQINHFAGNIRTEPDEVQEKQNSSSRRHWSFREKVATAFQHLSIPDDAHSWLCFAYTLYLFTCNNLEDIVVLGYSFGILCALCGPIIGFGASVCLHKILLMTPAVLFWSWANLLLFNIHNQRHPQSSQEDGINKAWRPLPAKRLTAAQATSSMYTMYPIVILFSLYSGGLGPYLLALFISLW